MQMHHQQPNRTARPSGLLYAWFSPQRTEATEASRAPLPTTLRGMLLFAASWVLTSSPLLFSVNPLPLSLLCAAEQHVAWIFTGLLLGLWQHSDHPWLYAGSAALAILLRLLCRLFLTPSREGEPLSPQALRKLYFSLRLRQLRYICRQGGNRTEQEAEEASSPSVLPPLFDEPIYLRVMVALISALLPCLGIPMRQGFAYYDLYGSVVYLLVLPVATWLFCFALPSLSPHNPIASDEPSFTPLHTIASAALFLSVCFCGRNISFLGLSPVLLIQIPNQSQTQSLSQNLLP